MPTPKRPTGTQSTIYAGTGTRRPETHAAPETPTKGGEEVAAGYFPPPAVWDKMVSSRRNLRELEELELRFGTKKAPRE